MEPHLLRWSSSFTLSFTNRLIIVPTDHINSLNPPFLYIKAAKRSPGVSSKGLQKEPKRDLSRILRTEAAIKGIVRKANSKKYNRLWPKPVLEALDEAIRANRWESALKAGMFEQMESALTDMVESGTCLPDVFTLNSFIWAYGNGGQIEQMEKWYDEFQLMGISSDITTFNILIRSYGRANMYEKMGSVMKFMKKRFFSPTIVTFNIIIEVFGRAGNIEKMDEFFLKMKHQGMKPNVVTYCSLVTAYSKAARLDKVESVLRQVENSDVVLDTPFFNSVLNAYGLAGDVEKMGQLFLAMKEKNCKPDNITFATMMQAYNAKGMIEAAQDLEDKMITTKDNAGMAMIRC